MPVSTAKLASIGSTACSSGPSIRLTWLGAISMRVPGRRQVLEPATSVRNSARNSSPPKSRTPSLPHLVSTNHDCAEAGDAEAEEDPADMQSARLQQRDEQRAGYHEGGLQHVAGGDDAGALGRCRPGLHGSEGGNDEQAAAEREGDEVDQHAQPGERGREVDRSDVLAPGGHADGPGEIETEQSP